MPRRAGVITIDLVGRSTKLQSETNAASGKLGQLGTTATATGKKIGQGMAVGSAGVRQLGVSAARTAEAVAALAASHLLAAGALAKYTATAGQSASVTDQLVTGYRALRIALSPTLFTASTLAAGVLVEETSRLVLARARLIDQQAAFASANHISFTAVDQLDTTSRIAGANPNNTRSLYTSLQSQFGSNQSGVQSALDKFGIKGSIGDPAVLGKIAAGLHSIADPAEQARVAFELFGSQGGLAVQELDSRFINSAAAAQKWGLALSEIDRTQIHQFRQDLLDLKEDFFQFSDIHAAAEKFKNNTEIVASAVEQMAKRGIDAVNDFAQPFADILNRFAGIKEAPIPPPPPVAGATRRGVTGELADQTRAQVEAANQRRLETTIAGQQELASQAEQRSRDALSKLKSDDEARELYRTQHQANPAAFPSPPSTLLNDDQRFHLSQEAQSGALTAEVTKNHIRMMEASKSIIELLSEKFSTLNQEMEKSAISLAAVGKSEKEKQAIEAEAVVQETRIEAARRDIAARTKPGEPILAPTSSQIANALPKDVEDKVRQAALAKIVTEAEKNWRTELQRTVDTLQERIQVQGVLTEAIGKTYKEQQAHRIESELMQEFGKEYSNPDRQDDIDRVRGLKTASSDAGRAEEIAKTNESLSREIELEKSLTAAQKQGADAVALVALAYKLRSLSAEGLGDEIAKEIELYNARKANSEAESLRTETESQQDSIDKLNLEIEGEQKLADAQLKGSEAVRQQTLANKLAMLDYESASTDVFDNLSARTKALEEARNKVTVLKDALATGAAYANQLEKLNAELAVITELEAKTGATRDLELDRLQIENQIADTLSKQALATGSLMDGLRAFFTEAAVEAEKPGKILYDGLNHAVDGLSDSITKAMDGQKANWGKMFQSVGQDMQKAAVKSMIQRGVGWVGQKLGVDLGQKKDGQSAQTALWVQMATEKGNALGRQLSGKVPALPVPNMPPLPGGIFGGGSQGGGIFSMLSRGASEISGAGSSAAQGMMSLPSGLINRTGDAVTSEGIPALENMFDMMPFADGGYLAPGEVGMTGEMGPEPIMAGRHGLTVFPNNSMGGGDTHVHYNIDARNADLGAAGRINAAIDQAHSSAVRTAVAANHERRMRTPQ